MIKMEKSNLKKIVILVLFVLVLLILLIINYFNNFNVEENIIDENKDKLFITITDEETYQIFENIIDEYKPDAISVEELFFNNNAKTAINVAQARGVILVVGCKKMYLHMNILHFK